MPVYMAQLTQEAIVLVESIQRYASLGTTRLVEDVLEMSLDSLAFGAVKPGLVRGVIEPRRYEKAVRISLSFKNKSNLRATAGAYGLRQGDVVECLLRNWYEDHLDEWKARDAKYPPTDEEQMELPH